MGAKRYLNVLVTFVLFIICLGIVYLLSLDRTEGHRGAGDQLYAKYEYEAALEEYRQACLVEYADLFESIADPGSLPLETVLGTLEKQGVGNERVLNGINDCWFQLGSIEFDKFDKKGLDEALLPAETYLTKVEQGEEHGEHAEEALAMLAKVQEALKEEVDIETGTRVVCAYTVYMGWPEPPEGLVFEGPVPPDGYLYIMNDTMHTEKLTKRAYLKYEDELKPLIIDDYASQYYAGDFMSIPSHIAEDSPVDLTVTATTRETSIELAGGDRLNAEPYRYMVFVLIEITNRSNDPAYPGGPEPYEFDLSNCRLYKSMETNFDEPMMSDQKDSRDPRKTYLADKATILPGQTLSGWIMFYTWDSAEYYFKIIRKKVNSDTGVEFSEPLVGKTLPSFR
ncbi:MAG: hypothetical protein NTW26_08125 [bacterium]|nr:hypothetical protein [bacterium]